MANRKPPKTQRKKSRFVATQNAKEAIWDDYFNNRMKNADILAKHNVSLGTFHKIIREKRDEVKEAKPIDPTPHFSRKSLDALARTIAVKDDAQDIVEATLALMAHHVKSEHKRLKADPTASPRISIKDLTAFFSESAPYVLPKIDSKKGADAPTPTRKLNDMFRSDEIAQA